MEETNKMSRKLMLIAAAICGLSVTAMAQAPAPVAATPEQKPVAEQKIEKKAVKKAKKAKKAHKMVKGTEKKAEAAPAPAPAPAQ